MFYPHSQCFIPLHHGYHGFDLKFTGHSLVVLFFYITRQPDQFNINAEFFGLMMNISPALLEDLTVV